jgi:hypothetical protein
MSCEVEMQHAPPVVADDEKAIKHMESDRWDPEEVHRGNGFPMIAQEAQPSAGRFRVPRCSAHLAGNGPLGHSETEHEKLTMDAWCAPGRILDYHSKNEIANFLRNASPPDDPAGFGDGAPIERKPRSVPTDNGLWANDDESLLPSRPGSSSQYPEELIECS